MANKVQKITIEDLLTLIAQGEGEKIEYKARSTNVAETVCAMANAWTQQKVFFANSGLRKR